MSRLVIISGVQQGRALRLKAGVNRIGRSPETHFQIPDPSVSAVHCEIIFGESQTTVRDLGSTNGTFINGERISEGVLRLTEILQLGSVELRLDELAEGPDPAIAVPTLPTERLAVSTTLPDGALACANHPEIPGTYVCTQCHQALCASCVRIIQRISKDVLVFCSLCNGQCQLWVDPNLPQVSGKEGFLRRLSKTLRVGYRRRRA